MDFEYVKNKRILLVDDEPELLNMLVSILKTEGFSNIETAKTVKEAQIKADSFLPELAVLDVMLPDGDGFSLMERLKQKREYPILFLTARGEEEDKFQGFGLGADDYMEKPYNPAELTARVAAQLRRYHTWGGSAPQAEEEQLVNGGVVLDKQTKKAIVDGAEVKLTATEYKILELLMEHPGQVFSAEKIYERVWKELATGAVENTVMVHIRHIREKLEIDTKNPKYVKVVWGIGYKMEKY